MDFNVTRTETKIQHTNNNENQNLYNNNCITCNSLTLNVTVKHYTQMSKICLYFRFQQPHVSMSISMSISLDMEICMYVFPTSAIYNIRTIHWQNSLFIVNGWKTKFRHRPKTSGVCECFQYDVEKMAVNALLSYPIYDVENTTEDATQQILKATCTVLSQDRIYNS